MSKKAKTLALALTLALGAAAGGKYYYDGTPHLLGHCYVFNGTLLIRLVDTVKAKTESGKDATAYVVVKQLGPFSIPMAFEVRDTNAGIAMDLKSGKLAELDCKTGEPLGK